MFCFASLTKNDTFSVGFFLEGVLQKHWQEPVFFWGGSVIIRIGEKKNIISFWFSQRHQICGQKLTMFYLTFVSPNFESVLI